MAAIVACRVGIGAAIELQSYGVAKDVAYDNFRGDVFEVLIIATY